MQHLVDQSPGQALGLALFAAMDLSHALAGQHDDAALCTRSDYRRLLGQRLVINQGGYGGRLGR
ncbi:hypothetical protein HN018_23905 (plasmid) [Lichenicola cladoniae]|uniref:Uncharacterized protein n=1 Tax=Lichenicola cladoniae TaxID=1484109 RepID=A0A6M8HXH3_9PROT|nr:hypothetical protein [Lichenicola cladoniae]NPD69807.1 hypothetical protein [Acetobacteraceae bacterium]QKE93223.1 hypothetical protein HN018_23905 [Lichenicola cladoniae]